jgi:hypothetical protein
MTYYSRRSKMLVMMRIFSQKIQGMTIVVVVVVVAVVVVVVVVVVVATSRVAGLEMVVELL